MKHPWKQLVLLLLLGALCASCDAPSNDTPEPRPAAVDPVLARSGQAALRASELDGVLAYLSLRGQALAPPLDDETVVFVVDEGFRCRAIEEALDERGIEISEAELQREAQALLPAGAAVGELDATIKALAETHQMGQAAILWGLEALSREQALIEARAAELPETAIWQAYRAEQRQAELTIVRLLNLHSPEEISALVATQPDAIKAFYQAHLERYYQPATAVLRRVAVAIADPTDPASCRRAEAEAEELREEALQVGLEAVAYRRAQTKRDRARAGLMPKVTAAMLPEAFSLELHEISEVMRFDDSYHFFVVEAREPAVHHALDEGLAREIAAQLLNRQIAPSLEGKIEAIRAALQARASLPEFLGLEALGRFTFSQEAANKRILGLGLVPELVGFALDELAQVGQVSRPFLLGQHIYLLRLEALHYPQDWPSDEIKASYSSEYALQQAQLEVGQLKYAFDQAQLVADALERWRAQLAAKEAR